jgi:hypothetical protein
LLLLHGEAVEAVVVVVVVEIPPIPQMVVQVAQVVAAQDLFLLKVKLPAHLLFVL